MNKKLFFALILAGSLLTSCGNSASSDLIEKTEELFIETECDNGSAVQELMALMDKAESGDADSVEALIAAMYSRGVFSDKLSYSAEIAKWQIYADWLALGIKRKSDVCTLAAGVLLEQQKKIRGSSVATRDRKDYAISKVLLASDADEIESQAKEAYKRLRAIPEDKRSRLEREILDDYQNIKEG